jgi:hypothetical protein
VLRNGGARGASAASAKLNDGNCLAGRAILRSRLASLPLPQDDTRARVILSEAKDRFPATAISLLTDDV